MSEDISFSVYDQINSGFVAIAALFYVLNLLKLIKDKEVKGISKISIAFFSAFSSSTGLSMSSSVSPT